VGVPTLYYFYRINSLTKDLLQLCAGTHITYFVQFSYQRSITTVCGDPYHLFCSIHHLTHYFYCSEGVYINFVCSKERNTTKGLPFGPCGPSGAATPLPPGPSGPICSGYAQPAPGCSGLASLGTLHPTTCLCSRRRRRGFASSSGSKGGQLALTLSCFARSASAGAGTVPAKLSRIPASGTPGRSGPQSEENVMRAFATLTHSQRYAAGNGVQ